MLFSDFIVIFKHYVIIFFKLGEVSSSKLKESRSVVSDSLQPHGLYIPWNSLGQNPGVGSLFLFQWIFLTQELNRGLLHCRRILYQLSYQGSQIKKQI